MINEIMTKSISKICCTIKSGFISELNIYLRCDLIIEAQTIGVIEMIMRGIFIDILIYISTF